MTERKDSSRKPERGKQERYDGYEIRLDENLCEPAFAVKSSGVGAFPLGDIQAIKAKSKSGKTYAASIFAAVMLGAEIGNMRPGQEDARVLFFDTEQNQINTANVMRRIHALRGWYVSKNTDRFHVYSLRRMDLRDRCEYITAKVQGLKPSAVIIDGIADLMVNFNDIDESALLIDRLMKLSADNNCAVITVLHENKAKTDTAMKGHLGTLLQQKASDVFRCDREGDSFTVTETDSRNIPIEDFTFRIDRDGMPYVEDRTKGNGRNAKVRIIETVMKDVYDSEEEGLTYTELTAAYALQADCSERTAKRDIATAKKTGIIYTLGNGKYQIRTK